MPIMVAKRRIGYQAIGFEVSGTRDLCSQQALTSRPPAKAALSSSRQSLENRNRSRHTP